MKLKLIEKHKETKDIITFIFEPEIPIKWVAGQYLIYSLPHNNQDIRGKMRFFTISSAPFEKNPAITTRISKNKGSSFKKALDNLKIGSIIEAKGPDGDFIIDNLKRKYVFLAGGVGITPFRSILNQLEFENENLEISLLYSNKNNEILFKKGLNNLKLKNLKINYLVGKRINTSDIKKINDFEKRIFYVSGPNTMVEETERLLVKLGIKKEDIKSDYFSGYNKEN